MASEPSDPSFIGLSGSLSQLVVAELLQRLEAGGRSGEARFETELGPGVVWFAEGRLIDAAMGGAQGVAAVMRLLGARGGKFAVEYKPVSLRRVIDDTAVSLASRRVQRAAAWQSLSRRLPPLDSVLSASSGARDSRREFNAEDRAVLGQVDGHRTLMEVVDHSGLDAVVALSRVAVMLDGGLLSVLPGAPLFSTDVPDSEPDVPPLSDRLHVLAGRVLAAERQLDSDPPTPPLFDDGPELTVEELDDEILVDELFDERLAEPAAEVPESLQPPPSSAEDRARRLATLEAAQRARALRIQEAELSRIDRQRTLARLRLGALVLVLISLAAGAAYIFSNSLR